MNLLNGRDVTNACRGEKKPPNLATHPISDRAAPSAIRPALPERATANSGAARSQNTRFRQWEGGGAGRGGGAAGRFEPNARRGGRRGGGQSGRGGGASPCAPPPLRCPPSAAPRCRRARGGSAAGPPRHVGEHGGAAAPGDDQPVRAGGRLRRRPGQAAAAGGPLAVRDGPERLLPGDQHPQQPPPPPDDVHPQQHAGHAAQLPGRSGHVLQAADLREPAEQQQPHHLHGLLPPGELQPLLGLLAPEPPARLAAPLLAHRPRPAPPPAPPAARLAPRAPARRPPTESRGHHGRPEIRLGWRRGGGTGGVWARAFGSRGSPRNALESFSRLYYYFWGGGTCCRGGHRPTRASARVASWSFLPPFFFFKYITIIYKYI